MAIWDDLLSDEDKAVFAASGHGQRGGLGTRPAVIVIDMNYNFCGDRPEPILESIKRWRASAGERAWVAAERVAPILAAARAIGAPVIYTTGASHGRMGSWQNKSARVMEDLEHEHADGIDGNAMMPLVAPEPGDIVIEKVKPSGFFGTDLLPMLIERGIDSLIVCGVSTSGCVRSTVVDAFSWNYRVMVVEDGTFDRCMASHRIGLLDMDMKYADVEDSTVALAYLDDLAKRRDAAGFGASEAAPVARAI